MKTEENNSLSIKDIKKIKDLAKEKRGSLGCSGDLPIANDLYMILEKYRIVLLEYPIEDESDRPTFSAVMHYCDFEGEPIIFIGLNTADYYDKQVFAIAFELYHFYENGGKHFRLQNYSEDNLIETKANRFAAEFLLPEEALRNKIFDEFNSFSLKNISTNVLLRFIARMHCIWWLPYRSLVKRLLEIDAITNTQYQLLYEVDERKVEGEYRKIGQTIQKDIFTKLNTKTKTINSSSWAIETVIRNFENNLIDEDSFVKILGLFDKQPEDFGHKITVSQFDIDEIKDFFEDDREHKN
jgi:Zn-dependent peptidase ImmA (M78 family)